MTEFDKQQPTIKFTIEKELDNCINFLAFSVCHREKILNLHNIENPIKQIQYLMTPAVHTDKISSINCLVNRLNTYPISKESKKGNLTL